MSRLALPVVAGQVGMMAMGVVDTLMVGRVSGSALAAVALGNLYFLFFAYPAMGTLMVLDPIVAQAVGAGDSESVAHGVQRACLLAVLLSVVVSAMMLPVHALLSALHQPANVVPVATTFVLVSLPGVLPFLLFTVWRQTLQALSSPRAIVVVIIVANVLNAVLNWIFVYGHAGSPALGAAGSAWATLVSRWLMAILPLGAGWSRLRPALRPWRRTTVDVRALCAMLWRGLPIGLHQGLELGAFAAIGVLMGVLGTTELAAHQIAINLASLTFMVPLGVGAAAAVRVGNAAGASDSVSARESTAAALVCGAGFMAVAALVFMVMPGVIASRYSRDTHVLTLAVLLIPIAGVFQVFDGVQAVCAGVLRGLGDTRTPFLINLTGFWVVGLPLSVVLAFRTPLRALGLWWGMVASLAIVASLLLWRVHVLLSRPVGRTA